MDVRDFPADIIVGIANEAYYNNIFQHTHQALKTINRVDNHLYGIMDDGNIALLQK